MREPTAQTAERQAPEWRILGAEGLCFQCWDGEYFVYHAFSGMTHYLDATAGAVFAMLMERPATAETLAAALATLAGIAADNAVATVRQVLARLDEVGLAEAAR